MCSPCTCVVRSWTISCRNITRKSPSRASRGWPLTPLHGAPRHCTEAQTYSARIGSITTRRKQVFLGRAWPPHHWPGHHIRRNSDSEGEDEGATRIALQRRDIFGALSATPKRVSAHSTIMVGARRSSSESELPSHLRLMPGLLFSPHGLVAVINHFIMDGDCPHFPR